MNDKYDYCCQCGETLENDALFCSDCGAKVAREDDLIDKSSITWDFDIPFWNSFILQGLLKAFGIPLVLLISLLGYFAVRSERGFIKSIADNADGLFFTAILLGLLLGLTALVLAIVYKGKYAASFIVHRDGAAFETRTEQRKINTAMNTLLIVAGFLTGKPGYAGTGMIAQASQSGAVEWKEVHRITAYAKSHTVVLHNWWRKVLILYCTAENYEEVLAAAEEGVARTADARTEEFRGMKKYFLSVFTWLPAVVICTVLVAPSTLLDNIITVSVLAVICAMACFCGGNVRRFLGFMGLFVWFGNILLMLINAMQVHTYAGGLIKVSRISSALDYDLWSLLLSAVGMVGFLLCIRRNILRQEYQGEQPIDDKYAAEDRKVVAFKSAGVLITGMILLLIVVAVGIKDSEFFAKKAENGGYEKTMEEYMKANEKLNKTIEKSMINSGNAENIKGDYDKAISDANSVIENNPQSTRAYFVRGNAYYGKKDYKSALADYSVIINLEPGNASAYYNRGITYEALGDSANAQNDYKKAADLGHEKAKNKLKAN